MVPFLVTCSKIPRNHIITQLFTSSFTSLISSSQTNCFHFLLHLHWDYREKLHSCAFHASCLPHVHDHRRNQNLHHPHHPHYALGENQGCCNANETYCECRWWQLLPTEWEDLAPLEREENKATNSRRKILLYKIFSMFLLALKSTLLLIYSNSYFKLYITFSMF